MVIEESLTLANGATIPKIGLGTWFIPDGDAAHAVRDAVEIGYRHIDTAQAYGNERGVGEGVRTCGLPREQLFVTSKLAADIKSYDEARGAIDGSLARSGLDQLDLMLVHSPQPWDEFGGPNRYEQGNRDAWRALEDAYESGTLRSIGVSNFQAVDVDNVLGACRVAPMVNQILAHISNTPFALIDYSQRQGMVVEAYSPMAHGELFKNRRVAEMSERYGISLAQLSIRYTLQLGLLPLPKTTKPAHMRTNAAVDFQISDADMDALRAMDAIDHYGEADHYPVFTQR